MKIITYRELEPKDEFMMLIDLAFFWPMSPRNMEERIRTDVRLEHSPVGFCASEDGQLAGNVGVMDFPTKTVEGQTEIVGGLWCVATNPAFARRGIYRALMEEAHRYFQTQRYRFSFLRTSRTIIAYAIYLKLGYEEVQALNRFPGVCKVFDKTEPAPGPGATCLDPKEISRVHRQFVEDKTGFVVRQEDFFQMLAGRKKFDETRTIQKRNGYALLTES
ncbi:MAG: GNAT family N-acetyltransferase [Candidatus Zixiibacteriota bacterium]